MNTHEDIRIPDLTYGIKEIYALLSFDSLFPYWNKLIYCEVEGDTKKTIQKLARVHYKRLKKVENKRFDENREYSVQDIDEYSIYLGFNKELEVFSEPFAKALSEWSFHHLASESFEGTVHFVWAITLKRLFDQKLANKEISNLIEVTSNIKLVHELYLLVLKHFITPYHQHKIDAFMTKCEPKSKWDMRYERDDEEEVNFPFHMFNSMLIQADNFTFWEKFQCKFTLQDQEKILAWHKRTLLDMSSTFEIMIMDEPNFIQRVSRFPYFDKVENILDLPLPISSSSLAGRRGMTKRTD